MTRKRVPLTGALLLALAVLAPAAALGVAHETAGHTVVLKNFRFRPGDLTIRHGDSVTWVWGDSEEHNVTSSSFHSRTMVHGSFTVRFNRRGTFNYRCTLHEKEGMRGKIVVD